MRPDNAPELIRGLFDDASQDRRSWLAEELPRRDGRGLPRRRGAGAGHEPARGVPVAGRPDGGRGTSRRPPRAGKMRVKDVAAGVGQGTASLGLTRYYVLVEGARADATDDLMVEFKQARRSALAGLTPPSEYDSDGRGERIARAQRMQLVNGDVFYGAVEFEDRSYVTRERSPFRDDVDLDDLSKEEWKAYAGICGRALAKAHALADEAGNVVGDVEPQIVAAIGPPDLFVDDVLRFAEEAAARVRADHEHFLGRPRPRGRSGRWGPGTSYRPGRRAASIADHARRSDLGHAAALIDRCGTVDRWCVPGRLAACFAALLDTPVAGGCGSRRPAGRGERTRRRYRDGTLVLETEWDDAVARAGAHGRGLAGGPAVVLAGPRGSSDDDQVTSWRAGHGPRPSGRPMRWPPTASVRGSSTATRSSRSTRPRSARPPPGRGSGHRRGPLAEGGLGDAVLEALAEVAEPVVVRKLAVREMPIGTPESCCTPPVSTPRPSPTPPERSCRGGTASGEPLAATSSFWSSFCRCGPPGQPPRRTGTRARPEPAADQRARPSPATAELTVPKSRSSRASPVADLGGPSSPVDIQLQHPPHRAAWSDGGRQHDDGPSGGRSSSCRSEARPPRASSRYTAAGWRPVSWRAPARRPRGG